MLRETKPSWRHTDLGRAIAFAGDVAVTHESESKSDSSEEKEPTPATSVASNSSGPAHLIVVTDMQAGAQIESLQVYAWPKELRLDVRKVIPQKRTNASAQILAGAAEDGEDPDRIRVRVANAPDSESGKFSLAWSASDDGQRRQANAEALASELPVQVPPGQTRVVRMPSAPPGVNALLLKGDAHTFDNTRYVVSPEPAEMTLQYIGETTADPRDSLLYYLQRVPLNNLRRTVTVDPIEAETLQAPPNPKQVPLIVLSQPVSGDVARQLREYVEAGGRLLVVLADQASADGLTASVNAITSGQLSVREAEIDDYVMWSKIDFGHPVFEPMADPQFNDFSKIRFWNHRKLENVGEGWQLVASFDDGDPALIETTIGNGRLLVMTTGWQPEAGQLALSTKFIPLVYSLFDLGRRGGQSDQYTVGESIDYEPSPTATITGPAGVAFAFRSEEDLQGIDQPGVYRFRDGEDERAFAVNLDESESRTDAIGDDELERFGVLLGKNLTTAQAVESQRQLRDRELESQQKLWQWLLVAALGILGLETLLGGLWSRRQGADSIAASTAT